jgi:Fibronectin type III domain
MRHFFRTPTPHISQSRRTDHASATSWFWQILGITAFICLVFSSEGLACHDPKVRPTSLTFYAVQGATNPPSQALTFTRLVSTTATLTASDNATWLTVSPATSSISLSKTLTAAVNTSGKIAGTYTATITIKLATWCTYYVPVTLIISPPGGGGGGATSSATLRWNAATGTVSGYKVYVGEAPRLYTRTITLGNVTSSTVSSLTVGRTYYFAVTAYNSAGQSPLSNEVSTTIR